MIYDLAARTLAIDCRGSRTMAGVDLVWVEWRHAGRWCWARWVTGGATFVAPYSERSPLRYRSDRTGD